MSDTPRTTNEALLLIEAHHTIMRDLVVRLERLYAFRTPEDLGYTSFTEYAETKLGLDPALVTWALEGEPLSPTAIDW